VDERDEIALHPRPLRRRLGWLSLDGPWDFALEAQATFTRLSQVPWKQVIEVPFSPETRKSGIGDTGFHEVCWYRKTIQPPELQPGERLLLHFNAVDYDTWVWVNGSDVVHHEGGYTPFTADLTPHLDGDRPVTIIVRAEDDPHDLSKPRGKQDWELEPHSIWFPRTSGIWQTVWLEVVPQTRIEEVRWCPNLERWEIAVEACLGGRPRGDLKLRVELRAHGQILAQDVYGVIAGEVNRRIAFSDPGVDDHRNALLWSPQSPTLIDAKLELLDSRGHVLDRVESYTALRSIGIQGHTFLLNGRPYPLRLVLDQGYWPESGLTAPSNEALRRDVLLAKEMGFNGVRKHQKIEDPRYYYWADHEGLLVWVEMPSAYRFTTRTVERVTREWMNVLHRDYSHPCVMAWVPFNESWGVPNLPEVLAQRHFVQGLYSLTKTLDPTRPVIGNDGWESSATDIIGIHDYDDNVERLASRYRSDEDIPHLFQRERPAGRVLALEGHPHQGQPLMLTEFGGIAFCEGQERWWGYSCVQSPEELAARYKALLETIRSLPALAGFCYTQFTDTYQEANGLLTMDRTPKFPLEQIAEATRGPRLPRQAQVEQQKAADRGAPGSQHDAAAP
jgi:beta-galactosidase/beta-glucuronidase